MNKLCGSHVPADIKAQIMAVPPYSLGFPDDGSQSTYYLGDRLQRDEIANLSRMMEQHNILPENTRLRKKESSTGETVYTVLQASAFKDSRSGQEYGPPGMRVILEQADHADELAKICHELNLASAFTANETQKRTIELYIKSFETGNLGIYRDALRSWVRDVGPKIEHIIGFVEPYRDPYGIRAEFEGLVAIADLEVTKVLQKLVQNSDTFIRKLPWCERHEEEVANGGKGPFEKSLFEPS